MIKKLYRKLQPRVWNSALSTYVSMSSPYQPLGSEKVADGGRPNDAFEARWQRMKQEIEACEAKNLLDIGCAQGWFVRNARVQCNLFALGLDRHQGSLRLGSAFRELQAEEGYGFVPGTFTSEELERLPTFDVVVCLSLVHHIIKVDGAEGGLKFLSACRKKVKKRFFFDMGGPDEVSHTWASKMGFLSGDIENNTRDYLAQAGFTNIEKIGESLAHEDDVMRPLFVCSP